jgi:hypothetical protein
MERLCAQGGHVRSEPGDVESSRSEKKQIWRNSTRRGQGGHRLSFFEAREKMTKPAVATWTQVRRDRALRCSRQAPGCTMDLREEKFTGSLRETSWR